MRITKIRTKLLMILLPLFMISFIVLSGTSYYLSNNHLTASVAQVAETLGDKFALEVASQLSLKMTHIEDIAASPQIRGLDEAVVVERLALEKQRREGYTTLFFVNLRDPAFHYGITAERNKFDYTTRSYTEHILQDKKSYVSKPSVSSTTGKLSVMLVTPVMEQGTLTGILGGTISLDFLSGLMEQIQFKRSGYGYIADDSGLIIANHKDAELVGKANMKEGPLSQAFQSVLDSGKQAQATYEDGNETPFTAILTPIELQGSRWVLVVTAPSKEFNEEAGDLAETLTLFSIGFLIIIILLIAYFCQHLAKPLQVIRDECRILNEGDLSAKEISVTSHDEVGQLARGFDKMRNTLRALIRSLQSKAERVAAASEELTASAHQSSDSAKHVASSIGKIAEGADDQMNAVQESLNAAKQMSAVAENISSRTEDVSKIADDTNQEVEKGRNEIAKVVVQMNKIDEGSKDVEKSIGQLADCSKEISSIVALISSIAGQTNLLALNAAIEAARAGEHGKGFAVVAEEVRKLAEESNQASKRIAELVTKNQEDMQQAINATKASSDGVHLGLEAVNSADETFKNIVAAISTLSQEITDISRAIGQMNAGCGTMMDASRNIDAISNSNASDSQSVSAATEQQAANMRGVSEASQSLAALANELQFEVSKFKV